MYYAFKGTTKDLINLGFKYRDDMYGSIAVKEWTIAPNVVFSLCIGLDKRLFFYVKSLACDRVDDFDMYSDIMDEKPYFYSKSKYESNLVCTLFPLNILCKLYSLGFIERAKEVVENDKSKKKRKR